MFEINKVGRSPNNACELEAQAMNNWYGTDTAKVETKVTGLQRGRVRRDGVYWNAVCKQGFSFSPGQQVQVLGHISDKLLLVVGPLVSH